MGLNNAQQPLVKVYVRWAYFLCKRLISYGDGYTETNFIEIILLGRFQIAVRLKGHLIAN